ncbi:hypothetical protein [Flavobacterium rhizosphaerae]|uniref:Uncharacterized protein n=1 Tax=Flavobacterium rhizosphaerae TaxID=3163298 RepID=A0ABW8YWM6_9FLAO
MPYIIYDKVSTAQMRLQILTDDAVTAGYLPEGVAYHPLIIHPTDDKAAIWYENVQGVTNHDGTTLVAPVNFEGLFTGQELARQVDILPEDWNFN